MPEPITILGVTPEPRDEDNIPVGCPLDKVALLRYAMQQLDEPEFDPCTDCEFFKIVRGDGQGRPPRRDAGAWYDYGFCTAPERRGRALVSRRQVDGRARKVTADDRYQTDDLVLGCIDHGHVIVREIVEHTGLAERTVFKVLARLRTGGTLAMGTPIQRISTLTVRSKVAARG